MTNEQEGHLFNIKRRISSRLEEKYAKGQAEHGGNLWQRDTLSDLGMEIVDMLTYFHCVEDDILLARMFVNQLVDVFKELEIDYNDPQQSKLIFADGLVKRLEQTLNKKNPESEKPTRTL